jgi:type II restriction enzyme
MNRFFNIELAVGYVSSSQRIRVMSEPWVVENIPCTFCKERLVAYEANRVGYDFFCSGCDEKFQLKCLRRKFSRSIIGGEYSRTVEKFQNGSVPNLLLLIYEPNEVSVMNLYLIRKEHLSLNLVIARKPLGPKARRAGWQGCNWRISEIPEHHREQIA